MSSNLLGRLSKAWRKRESPALRGALVTALLLTLSLVALIARNGTSATRLGAALLLGVSVLSLVLLFRYSARRWRDERHVLRRILFAINPDLCGRAVRAFDTVHRTSHDETFGSSLLAKHHYEKLIRQASLAAVHDAANKRAARWRWAALATLALLLGLVVPDPVKIFEGFNVLLAQNGTSPMAITYLELKRVSVKPPSYLRAPSKSVMLGVHSEFPIGSTISVKGEPRYEGRKLVLSDGERDVPFVSDGHGGVTANWTLTESSHLRVASRHGDIRIEEPETLVLEATPDRTPEVWVEGAPRTLALKDLDQLDMRYHATDDHGIRQVDLVISSGKHDSRRLLLKLDGDDKVVRGGYSLQADDDFLKRMFLPVQLTIEAKDDDPVSGPKWGRSPAIVVLPPIVGEPEALRFQALVTARNKFVATLAGYSTPPAEPAAAEHRERLAQLKKLKSEATQELKDALDRTYAGLEVPAGLKNFLLGQLRALTAQPRPGVSSKRQLEDAILAIDVALQRLGSREARSVAILLADVVEDIAEGARQARETEARKKGLTRLDHAYELALQGATQLGKLGLLGADLGSVAIGDLDRVKRARQLDDLSHAELAARHLAERLRRPNPSFGSAARGGVESGSSGRGGTPQASPSESDQQFDQLARELEQLANEHAMGLSGVEEALEQARQASDNQALKQEAERRAQALRESVAGLPEVGADPGSSRASAALAREHAKAMAQNLEQLDLEQAVQSAEQAQEALKEAKRKANSPSLSDWLDMSALERANQRIQQDLEWARTELEKQRREIEQRARQGLSKASDQERELAKRAGNLSGRGRNAQTPLPEDILKRLDRAETLMREAARELAQGSAETGLSLQRDAQRLLEQARTGKTTDPGERGSQRGETQGGRDVGLGGDVPDPGEDRAKKFRQRVLEGLGKEREGRLAPAIKRYAEELLK